MPKRVELKVGVFVVVTMVLIISSVVYIAYSKGFFSQEHSFSLVSKTGEDLTEGMPVFFAGFNIGRVAKLELSDQGFVQVRISIPDRHVKWIRQSSLFRINKPLIGPPRLSVTTTDFTSPLLSSRENPEIVRIDDINETIKRVQPTLEKVDKVVEHIEKIMANLADPRGDVSKILKNAGTITGNFAKKESVVEMVVGKPESVESIHDSIKKANDILVKVDALAAKTDDQVYGPEGAVPLVRKILNDLLLKLEKMNAALENVIGISSDAAESTKDLRLLRVEIDSTINAIQKLVKEIDSKIPFKKEPEIKLP
jgi:phospholipid/cholesterol/gamma-HCH transport system substrate-binding protein